MRNRSIAVFVSVPGASLLLHAAPPGRQAPASEAGVPTPRWSDGRVNLGAPPGAKGLWEGSGRLVIDPNSYDANRGVQSAPVHIDDVPTPSDRTTKDRVSAAILPVDSAE